MSALTLADAKAHLNITVSTYDVELQAMIDAAEAILANVVGPLTTGASRTDRVPGRDMRLVLPIAPVVSVASVTTPSGVVVDLSTVTQNLPAGVLYHTDNSGFGCDVYDVTYTPGRATCPADLLLGVKEMVRHLWTTQRGAATRIGPGGGDAPGISYLVPYRVQELIEPYRLVSVGAA